MPTDAPVRLKPARIAVFAVDLARRIGAGQELRQVGADTDRAGARTAAAVRRREGLVQVEVHDVDAEVAGAGDAEDGVEVGAVVVDQAASLVDDLHDLLDVLVPQAERVRVGDHQSRRCPGRPARASVSRSTLPRASDGTVTTLKPAIAAVAGLVPWAESGTRILVSRAVSPRASW